MLNLSHPTWVRGLKLRKLVRLFIMNGVAPHVGAWIETVEIVADGEFFCVAPHVGAWIETSVTDLL